jgi:methyl-accepting chemotaxis protein
MPRHVNARNHPQKPNDPEWNNLNCRSKRIYTDGPGLAAARNKKEFLLQTIRIKYLNNTFTTIRDCSAPIYIKERHWGCVRVTYDIRITDADGNDALKQEEVKALQGKK